MTASICGNVSESTNPAKESAGAASETTAAGMELDKNAMILKRVVANFRLLMPLGCARPAVNALGHAVTRWVRAPGTVVFPRKGAILFRIPTFYFLNDSPGNSSF